MPQLNRGQLSTNINSNIFTNTSQQVTATNVNQVLQNISDSSLNLLTDASLLSLKEFDPTRSYVVGEVTIYNGVIYQAAVNVSPGAFDIADWNQIETPVFNGITKINDSGIQTLSLGGTLNFDTQIDCDGKLLGLVNGNLVVGAGQFPTNSNNTIYIGDCNTVRQNNNDSIIITNFDSLSNISNVTKSFVVNNDMDTLPATIINSDVTIIGDGGGDFGGTGTVRNSNIKVDSIGFSPAVGDVSINNSNLNVKNITTGNNGLTMVESELTGSVVAGEIVMEYSHVTADIGCDQNNLTIEKSSVEGSLYYSGSNALNLTKSKVTGQLVIDLGTSATIDSINSTGELQLEVPEVSNITNVGSNVITGTASAISNLHIYGNGNQIHGNNTFILGNNLYNDGRDLSNRNIINVNTSTWVPSRVSEYTTNITNLNLHPGASQSAYIAAPIQTVGTGTTTAKYFGKVEMDNTNKTITCPVRANDLVLLTCESAIIDNFCWSSNITNGSFQINVKHSSNSSEVYVHWMIVRNIEL